MRVLKSDDDIEENVAIDDHSYKHNLGIDCFPVNDTPLTQIQQIHSRPIDIFVKKSMRKLGLHRISGLPDIRPDIRPFLLSDIRPDIRLQVPDIRPDIRQAGYRISGRISGRLS